jgi:hypothetical protein
MGGPGRPGWGNRLESSPHSVSVTGRDFTPGRGPRHLALGTVSEPCGDATPMIRGMIRRRCGVNRTARRPLSPAVEALEVRTVLSASASLSHQVLVHALAARTQAVVQPILGTIQGRVTNDVTGRGVNNVKVELINANGTVVLSTITHAGGQYRFRVRQDGPYVVHAVTPRRFVQTSPTFASTAPVGSYATNPATGNPTPPRRGTTTPATATPRTARSGPPSGRRSPWRATSPSSRRSTSPALPST